jgi:hypothetical protein
MARRGGAGRSRARLIRRLVLLALAAGAFAYRQQRMAENDRRFPHPPAPALGALPPA